MENNKHSEEENNKKPKKSANKKIKSAGKVQAANAHVQEKKNQEKHTKKKVKHLTPVQKFIKHYGLLLLLFIFLSGFYIFWIYIMPPIMNTELILEKVNTFVETKIGFKVDYEKSNFYTTPDLNMGVNIRNLTLLFPGSKVSDENAVIMKARSANIEIPLIPFLLKTIRFNNFAFKTVKLNLYQNSSGKYAYLENLKTNFNPKMPNYLLEIPTIDIYAYNIYNYNQKTMEYKKLRGEELNIKPSQIKEVLRTAPNATTIMLR